MSMYKKFATDKNLEQKGIIIDYGDFRVKVARAGGSNQKYTTVVEAVTKPYRRAMATNTMDNKTAIKVLHEIYARAVILGWETQVEGKWKKGIEGKDGKLLPFSQDNILATFTELPDLFSDIQAQAEQQELFRAELLEEEAKN